MIFLGSLFMFILYFSFVILVSLFCRNRNIGFWGGFLISLFFSPLIGFIAGLGSGRKQQIILQAQPSVIIQQHIANNPTPVAVQQPIIPQAVPVKEETVAAANITVTPPEKEQTEIEAAEAAVIELLNEIPELIPPAQVKALSENTQ